MVLHTESVGDGRPVVVLPSFSLDGRSMAMAFEPAFQPAFASAPTARYGARMARPGATPEVTRIYVDLPGTGGSPAIEPSSDAVLDAVIDTVEALVGRRPFSLVGWSYGGYLALGLLRRMPTRVSRALLICTGTKIRPKDRDLTGTMASAEEPGWLDAVPARLHAHLRQAIGLQTEQVARRVAAVIAVNGPTDDGYLELLRSEGFALSDEGAPTATDRPAMVLAGCRDRVAGFRSLVDLLPAFAQGDLLLSAGAGHYLPLEDPDLLALAVLRWVGLTPAG